MDNLIKLLTPEVVAAAIGVVTTTVSSVFAYITSKEKKVLKEELGCREYELDQQRETFDVSDFLEDWDEFYWELHKLMQESCLDRFLMLRAWNGESDPRYTSAVLQIREGPQEPVSYVHVEMDQDYIDRLIRIKRDGQEYFLVEHIKDSLIKEIYMAEGVTASFWFFLHSEKKNKGHRITYCSFATHCPGGFSEEEITKMRILGDNLKGIARKDR